MRVLLDQGVPRSAASLMRQRGIAARHVGELDMARASDLSIIEAARRDGSIIVTLDADFHTLLAVSGAVGPSVIRVRIEGLNGERMADLIESVVAQVGDLLIQGAVATVTERNLRIKRLPIGTAL